MERLLRRNEGAFSHPMRHTLTLRPGPDAWRVKTVELLLNLLSFPCLLSTKDGPGLCSSSRGGGRGGPG